MQRIKTLILILLMLTCFVSNANDTLATSVDLDSISTNLDSLQAGLPVPVQEQEISNSFWTKLLQNPGLPVVSILLFLLGIAYMPLRSTVAGLKNLIQNEKNLSQAELFDAKEKLSEYSAIKNVVQYVGPFIGLGYLLYVAVIDTTMQGYVMEWLNLLVRWAHVIAGIMWIGASFYFIFLENNLNRVKNIRDELAGDLWAVHGGGFYYLEKYKVAPKTIPVDLHWFKYEAYFTFLTGFALLVIVYYMDARAFLIDPTIADISVPVGIVISLASLAIGWIIYDQLCKSPLINNSLLFVSIGFIILVGLAYFLTHIFNSRAAYIHFGAIIGTIMVGNVYFNIIPAQKAMVRSATIGEPLDASLGKKAGQRSLHNNYFTLPVIFIMISNHFPSTYGHAYNWVVLIVIALASAGIKHFWNLAERGMVRMRLLAISVLALLTLAFVISPYFEEKVNLAIPVSFQEANAIIQTRCVQCHSANPSDDVWKAAPNGVMYDTPEQIQSMADKIMTRAVRTHNMPQGNKTNMTEEERLILKRWIMQGAKIDE